MSGRSVARKGFILVLCIVGGAANDLWLGTAFLAVVVLLLGIDIGADIRESRIRKGGSLDD